MKIKLFHDLLIHVPDAYERERDGVHNHISIDNIKNVVRFGKVLSVPHGCDEIKEGDTVYVHHNITRRKMSMDGENTVLGTFEIDRTKGLYSCPLAEVFCYERDGVIHALSPYCFVKPIKNEAIKKIDGIHVVDKKKERPYIGILKYANKDLRSKGLKNGDKVVFAEWSMYEYPINGEKLYRMRTHKILGVWDE